MEQYWGPRTSQGRNFKPYLGSMKDHQKQIEMLCQEFQRAGGRVTLGFAESCTGGLLSAWITERPGVSLFFRGSVVSYTRGVKEDLLKISAADLDLWGLVSEKTAEAMAKAAQDILGATWAVGITGVAGPDGGTTNTPVGTVCIGICGPNFVHAHREVFHGNRKQIQEAAAFKALELLMKAVTGKEKQT